jgi:hypothetical protein
MAIVYTYVYPAYKLVKTSFITFEIYFLKNSSAVQLILLSAARPGAGLSFVIYGATDLPGLSLYINSKTTILLIPPQFLLHWWLQK